VDTAHESVITDRRFQRGKAVTPVLGILVLALLLRSMTAHTNSVVDIYIAIVAGVMALFAVGAYRAFRVGFVLSDAGLKVRQTYSTRFWTWDQIKKMDVIEQKSRSVIGPAGLGAGRLGERFDLHTADEIPVVRTVAKGPVPLRGMKVRVASSMTTTWIDDVVTTVNERLELRRGGTARPS
jgi:hypothetical protein